MYPLGVPENLTACNWEQFPDSSIAKMLKLDLARCDIQFYMDWDFNQVTLRETLEGYS